MKLDANYAHILLPNVPKMISEGVHLLGIHEKVGLGSNPLIMNMADALGVRDIYLDDDTAWCGLAHGYIIVRSGKFLPLKDWDILRALKYRQFGRHVDTPMFGDTLVFQRPEGGHVGLYVGEDSTHFHVMGGNQSNSYSITKIARTRLVEARRPIYVQEPDSVRPIPIGDTNTLVTHNEK